MLFLLRIFFLSTLLIFFCSQQCFAANPSQNSDERSIIQNGDFSKKDEKGNFIGWKSFSFRTGTTCVKQNAAKTIILEPGCILVSDTPLFLPFNHNQGVRMEIVMPTIHPHFQDFRLEAHNNHFTTYSPVESTHPSEIVKEKNHVIVCSTKPLSTKDADSLRIFILNTQSHPIKIKKIDVIQGGENPLPKSAALLKATHLTALEILPHSNIREIWMPLPLDYASQVPLWIQVTPKPLAIVDSVRYTQDSLGNWGVIVTLKNHVAAGTKLHFLWEGMVLTRTLNESERPDVYRATSDPTAWLQPTLVAQANYQPIVTTVENIIKNAPTEPDKMKEIIKWTSQNIGAGEMKSLDAAAVFDTKHATCTGFANLASAMGRASTVPTRTIANCSANFVAQQTHFINEFYLGPQLGWLRIEPQGPSTQPYVREDYGIMVRIVSPEDENNPASLHQSLVYPGVPYKSMMVNLNDPAANMQLASKADVFPDDPSCDNRAEHWIDLRGDHDEMLKLFEEARENWQYDLHAYLTKGEISPKRQAIRAKALSIQSADDLKELLHQLSMLK